MLSGIGPAAHLQAHGIPVVVDLPGVGQNLQDHLQLPVVYRSNVELPHSTLLTSIVHGGAALNIVPDHCTVDFECRGIGITESREVTDAIVAWARLRSTATKWFEILPTI